MSNPHTIDVFRWKGVGNPSKYAGAWRPLTFCVAGRGSFGEVSLARWKPGATQTVNGTEEPRTGVVRQI